MAIIGGSGLYELPGLTGARELEPIQTPYGAHSGPIVAGTWNERSVFFLPRHGAGHGKLPHEVNYAANIFALKSLGVRWVISVSAVGSMKEEIAPGDMVLVDQFIDRTSGRRGTLFGDGIVAHISMADPVSPVLMAGLEKAARGVCQSSDVRLHVGGTYLTINGPQFSCLAESQLYRQWGVSVIGMTNMPEAKLAREAELGYATLALVTDYDCWREGTEAVTVDNVLSVMRKNVERAKNVLQGILGETEEFPDCQSLTALSAGLLTDIRSIPAEKRESLAPLLERVAKERQR